MRVLIEDFQLGYILRNEILVKDLKTIGNIVVMIHMAFSIKYQCNPFERKFIGPLIFRYNS